MDIRSRPSAQGEPRRRFPWLNLSSEAARSGPAAPLWWTRSPTFSSTSGSSARPAPTPCGPTSGISGASAGSSPNGARSPLATSPEAIHRPDVRAYLVYLRRERALRPNSIARHLACLRSFFRFLQQDPGWRLPHDPTAGLVQPRPAHQPAPGLSPAAVEGLLAACQRLSPYPWRDRSALQLVAATGCRISQLVQITLGDLAPNEPRLSLPGPREPRVVPLDGHTLRVLRRYLQRERPQLAAAGRLSHDAPHGPLFLSARGAALSAASLERLFRRAWVEAGLPPPVSIQALRRSAWRAQASRRAP